MVGTDEKTDIAVIKVDAKDLPVVQLGDSDAVRVGQFAFAIGAPFKLDYTFTYGVVSAKGRSKLFTNGGYSISDYLQTDASINPGNSGGPLCDIDGKVIGMNTLINGLNRGLGFAIPSNMAREIGTELIAGHKIVRPWLGIRIESLGDDPSIRDLFKGLDKGVVVRTIEADAPANKSQLKPFDVITQVDGAVETTDSQLQHEILKKKVAKTSGDVWRQGKRLIPAAAVPGEISRAQRTGEARPTETGRFGEIRFASAGLKQRGGGTFASGRRTGRDCHGCGRQHHCGATRHSARRRDCGSDGKPVSNVQSFRGVEQNGSDVAFFFISTGKGQGFRRPEGRQFLTAIRGARAAANIL